MPNSALLTVNGWGHTALFMSHCADAAIERYLIDIATPPPGTTCDQDVAPFTTPAAASAPAARERLQALSYINGQSPRARQPVRRARAADRRAAGQAGSWSGLARSAIDALGAQVAVDDRGNAVYAWSSSDAATGITQVRAHTRSAKGGLGQIVVLSDPAADSFDVRVAVNASGAAAFSWLQFEATTTTLAVKTRSWSARGVLGPIADVSEPAIDASEHRIAISGRGAAAFTWTQGDPATGPTRVQARMRSAAGALGAIADLADPALDSFAPQVAIDADSVATFAWTQGDPAARRTRVQTRTLSPSGGLGSTTDLADAARNTGHAKVAIDPDGDAVFDWLASDQSQRSVAQMRSRSRTGAFGPVVDLSSSSDDAWDPVVAIDGHGAAVFTWWIVGRTGARVEARSRSARGTIAPRVTLSNAADDAYEPNVAIDAGGDAVLTWLAFTRDGVRVQARSRSPRGAFGALTDLTRPAQDAFSAQVAVSVDGDAAFGWSALNDTGYEVQGRSRSANGRLGPLAVISSADRDTFDAQVNSTAERLQHTGDHG